MGTAIFSLKIHSLPTFLVVVLEKVEVKIKFLSHLLIARIPPFLIPNLYNHAQCFRSSNKRNYQPKKVGKLAKWIQIVLEWVVHELFGSRGILVKKVICVAPGHKKCRIFVFLSVAHLRFLFKGL